MPTLSFEEAAPSGTVSFEDAQPKTLSFEEASPDQPAHESLRAHMGDAVDRVPFRDDNGFNATQPVPSSASSLAPVSRGSLMESPQTPAPFNDLVNPIAEPRFLEQAGRAFDAANNPLPQPQPPDYSQPLIYGIPKLPSVPPSENAAEYGNTSQYSNIAAGVLNTASGVINFLQSPEGIGLLLTRRLPIGIRPSIHAGIAGEIVQQIPGEAARLGEMLGKGDTQGAVEATANLLMLPAFAKHMGKEALSGIAPARMPYGGRIEREAIAGGIPRRTTTGLEGEPLIQPPPMSVDVPKVEVAPETALTPPAVPETVAPAVPREVPTEPVRPITSAEVGVTPTPATIEPPAPAAPPKPVAEPTPEAAPAKPAPVEPPKAQAKAPRLPTPLQEFHRLAIDLADQTGMTVEDVLRIPETIDLPAKVKKDISTSKQSLRLKILSELGLSDIDTRDKAAVAAAVEKLKARIASVGKLVQTPVESLSVDSEFTIHGEKFKVTSSDPEGNIIITGESGRRLKKDVNDLIGIDPGQKFDEPSTDFVPDEPAPIPKLRDKENQGDFDSAVKDSLSLTSPEEVDVVKSAKEKADAAQRAKEAKEIQDRQQQNLFEPPPAETKGPGMGQGPGARTATASQKPQAPESYEGTLLKHAADELERVSRDFGERPQQEKQPMLEAWIRSAKDPAANARLARELIDNPRRGLTGDESAMILRHKVALSNALNDAAERTITGKLEDKAFNQSEFDRASDELKTFMDAVNERGSEAGRELRWRQAIAYEDYTFATQERLLRAAKGGERLNDSEHAQLVKDVAEHKRLLEEYKKHAAGETERQTKFAEEAVQAVVDKYEKESAKQPKIHPDILDAARVIVNKLKARGNAASIRLKAKLDNLNNVVPDPTIIKDIAEIGVGKLAEKAMDFAEWSKSMIEDYGPKVERFLKDAYEASKQLLAEDLGKVKGSVKDQVIRKARKGADITEQKEVAIENIKHKVETDKLDELDPFIQKLTRLVIADGAKGWREVTDKVHAILKDIVPDLDYRDTMEAISGHGKISKPKPDPISVEKSKVTGLIHKILQIQEVIGRREVKGKGFQRGLTPDEQRRFNAIYNEAKRRFGIVNSESIVRSVLQARETFYKNRLADLKHEIETGKRIVRTKSPSPTSPKLEALQTEYDALKKEHDAIFPRPELTDVQKLEMAEKAATRMEKEWQSKLTDAKAGKFDDPTLKSPKAKSAKLSEIRARTDAARQQVKEMREATAEFKAEQEAKQLADVEARSAILEKEINEGFKDAKKEKKPISEKLQAAIDERDQLIKIKNQLRNAAKPKKSPEERALQTWMTRATNRLADLEARNADIEAKLASGDLTPADIAPRKRKAPLDISSNQAAMETQAKLAQIEERFAKNRFDAQQKLRTLPRKIWDGIKQTGGAFVNIVSSFDFSAPRQALPAILSLSTRPIRGWPELAKAVGRMFSGAFSEQRAKVIEQKIKNRPNSMNGTDKLMGLDLTELSTTKFSKYEDAAHSVLDEWAALPYKTGNLGKTIFTAPAKGVANLVRGSNRAFITFLNSTRASLADELLRSNYSKEAPTPVQLREVGYLVNLATGRGELSPGVKAFAANPIWSPNLLASRVKLATGMPLWRALHEKNPKAVRIVAEEYARVIASGFLLGSVAMLFDDKDGEPNTSSDFGKIVRGNTRIDLWGGFQQILVAENRVRTGITTSLKGKSKDMTAGKFGVDTPIDTLVRFGRSKLKPTWGIAVNIIDRKDFIGRNTNLSTEEGRLNVAKSLIPVPLSINDITSIMKERGFTEGMIIQALSAFGSGVSNYEDKESQK